MRGLFALLGMSLALTLVAPTRVVAQDATPTTEPESVDVTTGLARTDQRYFLPFTPDGLNPALSVTGNEQGLADLHPQRRSLVQMPGTASVTVMRSTTRASRILSCRPTSQGSWPASRHRSRPRWSCSRSTNRSCATRRQLPSVAMARTRRWISLIPGCCPGRSSSPTASVAPCCLARSMSLPGFLSTTAARAAEFSASRTEGSRSGQSRTSPTGIPRRPWSMWRSPGLKWSTVTIAFASRRVSGARGVI